MFKRFIAFVLVLLVLFNVVSPVFAAVSDDFMTFSQGDDEWYDHIYDPKTGEILGESGCMITAVAVLMAYANPALRDRKVFNPAVLADGMYVDYGAMVWSEPTKVDPTFTLVERTSDGAGSAANETIKKYLDQGYFVVVMTQGQPITSYMHFCPIVGWDSGTNKPKIWDVNSGKHTDWAEWETAGIDMFVVYQSSISKSLDVLGKSTGNASVGKQDTAAEVEQKWKMVTEWELQGMHQNSTFWSAMEEIVLPDESSLSDVDQKNMAAIRDQIEMRQTSIWDYVNIFINVLALIIEVYGVLLLVAYWADRLNNILDISLVSVLTFGKYMVWDEDFGIPVGYYSSDGVTYCDFLYLIKRVALICLLGFFILNKGVFKVINSVYYHITTIF